MLARWLTTLRAAVTPTEALETACLPRVTGRTGNRTALVTARRDRSSLWSSMAMRTGNGSDDFALRGWGGDDRASLGIGDVIHTS
jgi:hypothetical protein